MRKSYFLYVWLVRDKFFFPYKIYSSKSYAKKVAMEKGWLRFKIVTLECSRHTKYEIYRMCENEHGDQDINLGWYLLEKGCVNEEL